MRRTPKPWYVTALVMPAKKGETDTYGNAFAVLAICACGHAAEIPSAYQGDTTYAALRPKLKCSKCGARGPRLETYARPAE